MATAPGRKVVEPVARARGPLARRAVHRQVKLDQRLDLAMAQAQAHLAAGRLTEAADALAQEIPARRPILGSGGPAVLLAHNLMGVIAKFRGQFELAAHHYEVVAASPVLARLPELAATLEHNLGGLAHSRGDLEAAERHTRAALTMHLELTGAESAGVLSDLGQLGAIVSDRGRPAEAIEILATALDGLVALHGPVHVDVGIATTALAAARHRQGDLVEAERLYRDGLALRSETAGPDHPDLAWTLVNLAVVVRRTGRPDEAEDLLHRALAVLQGNVAPEHPLLRKLQDRLTDGP
ncbi:MAG: hypothetical protein JWM47_1200 [Acidimicrobiales bacterium]|nr:hypothetical protein [Acidimicrobiales bacterium]